jgi:hypothetical protein
VSPAAALPGDARNNFRLKETEEGVSDNKRDDALQ